MAMEVFNGHALEVEKLGGAQLVVDGATYTLREIVTHTPSEHRIHGEAADLELQLVHAMDDVSAAHAAAAGEQGAPPNPYLIVSVLLSTKAGNADKSPAFLDKLAGALPARARAGQQVPLIDGLSFGEIAAQLQPHLRTYYRYSGSLTTPPCTEGVTWFVASRPLPLSKDVHHVMAKLEGDNARPTQPLNGRSIRYVP